MLRCHFVSMLLVIFVAISSVSKIAVGQVVPHKARGTGEFRPDGQGGPFGGPGKGTHLGKHTYRGVLQLSQDLSFENRGRGTQNEILQEVIAADGSKLYFRYRGKVQLTPLPNRPGYFTATWEGDWEVAGGTGRFENVKPAAQPLKVRAVNEPFQLTDPVWKYSWEMIGQIRLR